MSKIYNLTTDSTLAEQFTAWVGDWHSYVFRLLDDDGGAVDLTGMTLGVSYTNVATGSTYSFVSGTASLTKEYSSQGIISILNPAAYPTAAVIRVTISVTSGSVVTRYGPVIVTISAP